MKELSIEEKAQRYDEAIKKAESLYKAAEPMSGCNVIIETLFPELKESEDERIREEIIKYLEQTVPHHHRDEVLKSKEWIAWLEKQGEHNNWKPSKEEMDVLYGLAYITNQYDEHKEEVITHLYQDLKREFFNGLSYENMFPNTEDGVRRRSTIQILEYARSLDTYNQYGKADIDKNIAWLERQGEQKPNPCDGCINRKGCINCENGELRETEQKSLDKVEPKFHEGDWITDDTSIFQIMRVENEWYYADDGDKICFDVAHQYYHLWTIADAKDGDILFQDLIGGKTFIYNGVNPEMVILYSFIISNDGENVLPYHIGKPNTGIGNIEENKNIIHPATKKQRDQLEKAMTDAGYTFDFEKKKLKKIEQKSTDKLELKKIEWNDCKTCGFRTLAYKQNTAWIDEDENRLTKVLVTLNDAYASKELLDWVESLKDRVQPKPIEWSEEDWNYIADLISYFDGSSLQHDTLDVISWLKSLRPQNMWKESLATADLENSLCDIQDGFSDTSYEYRILGEAIEFIRCTEQKPQWKPSGEQIDALNSVCGEDGISEDDRDMLIGLYTDLKKLREE